MHEQSTTTLFCSPDEVAHAIQAAELTGVTIEVFSSETDTDRTVAAEAFALPAELSVDPTIDPNAWRWQAMQAMELGGAVVRLVCPFDPDQPENKGDSGFWRAYSHLRSQR